ncbi:fumarylacetoacetate hydrolase family protein [Georgenia sp. AZ-5]|uniref:fumarylacetoacetate hydrolase family protein n=1 Tax=Georgenia sp. AZ-5 TaxID=3367526 RepID=UPI003754C07A
MALWHTEVAGSRRLAVGPPHQGPERFLDPGLTLADLLGPTGPALADIAGMRGTDAVGEGTRTVAPADAQPVWAAGVTFERSREARKEEAVTGDFYDRVYDADRPELFLKALPGQARGPGEPIGIRADSTWDVPEPELAVVADHAGRIVGYVLGDDVSSRSIEGENPLYLPQAKVYEGSCALGPCIVPVAEAPDLDVIEMRLTINRDATLLYKDSVRISQMRRRPEDLVDWLFRALRFPAGVVLLTGTSIVPEPEITLKAGDRVSVTSDGLGSLDNTVEVVGR